MNKSLGRFNPISTSLCHVMTVHGLIQPMPVGIGLSQKYFPSAHAAVTIVTIKAGCQARGESNPHNCTLAEHRSNLQVVICNLSGDGILFVTLT